MASGRDLTVVIGSTASAGFAVLADSVKLKSGAVIGGDLFFNQLDGRGIVEGDEITPLQLPVFSALPPFLAAAPGQQHILVERNEAITLQPGNYGELRVKAGGEVLFAGGDYSFELIDAGDSTSLAFEGPSEVRVAGRLSSGLNSTIGPAIGSSVTAQDLVFFVGGINGSTGGLGSSPKAAKIGIGGIVVANLCVPNGTLHLRQGTVATGAFFARDIIVGIGVQVELASYLATN